MRRVRLQTILLSFFAGIAVALALGLGRVELPDARSRTITSSVTGASGHRWNLRVWHGHILARDSLNLTITGSFEKPPPALEADPALHAIRRPLNSAWRAMIAEAAPQCTSGAFFNLQAWGFPFRSMAGGFAKGPPTHIEWYAEYNVLGRTRTFPTRPIWFGLIGNTLFYAAAIWSLSWLLVCAPGAARRRYRRRRGLCVCCAYKLAGLPPSTRCPECGTVN
jgi:hypothetical protein